jgi:hypothetical protein
MDAPAPPPPPAKAKDEKSKPPVASFLQVEMKKKVRKRNKKVWKAVRVRWRTLTQ